MYHGNLAACCAWLYVWRRPRLFWGAARQRFKRNEMTQYRVCKGILANQELEMFRAK
jgi:hypothetical protein